MPKIAYEDWSPRGPAQDAVTHANTIIAEYAAQGFNLTLRQLYYQFVSRALIPNKQQEYKRLGDIVSKARRAGLIDWDAIVDRTRNLQRVSTWETPASIVKSAASSFRRDLWATQENYVEVWFEKDALMGVFEGPANEWRVPFFSCRGYTSDSEAWAAAQRFRRVDRTSGRGVTVLHFGDHDPSGLDMSRDIRDRLHLFGVANVEVKRIALNMDQVKQYNPPPNPAKDTDSRFAAYRDEYGDESWELDALEPVTLAGLVEQEVGLLLNVDAWALAKAKEDRQRAELRKISEQYEEIVECHGVGTEEQA